MRESYSVPFIRIIATSGMTSSLKLHGLILFSAINFPIAVQAVPTYLNGLYAKETQLLHPWSLAFGSIFGLVYVFGAF